MKAHPGGGEEACIYTFMKAHPVGGGEKLVSIHSWMLTLGREREACICTFMGAHPGKREAYAHTSMYALSPKA